MIHWGLLGKKPPLLSSPLHLRAERGEKEPYLTKAFIKDLCQCWLGATKQMMDGQLNKCVDNFTEASTKQRWYGSSGSTTLESSYWFMPHTRIVLFLFFSGRLETKLCCLDVQTITFSKTCQSQTHRETTQTGHCILQGYSSSSSSSSSASLSHWVE